MMIRMKTDGIRGLLVELEKKKLICFGAGNHFDTVMNLYTVYSLQDHVEYLLDNNPQLWGAIKRFGPKEYRIMSLDQFIRQEQPEQVVLLVTNHLHAMEIVEQLDQRPELNGISVYIGTFLSETVRFESDYEVKASGAQQIPKIIHYCWFGGGEIPQEYQRYMESWKIFCPDYEIKRWDESNYDVTVNRYMDQAYQRKSWAFVSDYARLQIIFENGGIYLDCDVELIRNLDDFLGETMFCGFEDQNHINLGLGYGAVSGHPYLKRLMEYYESLEFVNPDGSLNQVPCPSYQTAVLKEFGIRDDNTFQRKEGITVYPTEMFSPLSGWGEGEITDRSCSIHHFGASWKTEEEREKTRGMYQAYCRRKMREQL